jgi:branched-subunit amino acid transport protein
MILAGAATYAIRLSFILLFGKIEAPASLLRALRFVPPAVLSAIIFPELLLRSGSLDLSFHNARLLAGAIAVLIAWRSKNVLLTIIAGMLALFAIQMIIR